jgi:hypothetical protein
MATGERRATSIATAWGPAVLVEEIVLPQRAAGKRYSAIVQLLETRKGERLVRFAYGTGGSARRGPLTLRAGDLERLRAALADRPQLAAALDLGGGA